MRFLAFVFAMLALCSGVRANEVDVATVYFEPGRGVVSESGVIGAHFYVLPPATGDLSSLTHKSNTQSNTQHVLTEVSDPFLVGSWTQIHVGNAFGSNEVFDALKVQKKVCVAGSAPLTLTSTPQCSFTWSDTLTVKAQFYGFQANAFYNSAIDLDNAVTAGTLIKLNRDLLNEGNPVLEATNADSEDNVVKEAHKGTAPWNWPKNDAYLPGESRFTYLAVKLVADDPNNRGGIRISVTTDSRNSCPLGSTCGDPQFSGLQGQNYQFHGMADEVFSLVSSPELQMNSLFKFISSGKCDYNDTMCWSHPGTYLGQIGIQFGADKILLQSGAHSEGMKVFINDKETTPSKHIHQIGGKSNNTAIAQFRTGGKFAFNSDKFYITVHNSDYFFNVDFGLKDSSILQAGAKQMRVTGEICEREARMPKKALAETQTQIKKQLAATYPAYPLHGLVGQTWRNAEYCGRYYEGTVDDYVVGSLFGNEHTFNYFSH